MTAHNPDRFLSHFWPAWHAEIRMWFKMATRHAASPDEMTGRLTQKLCRWVREGKQPVTPGLCLGEVIRWMHLDCEGAEAFAARVLRTAENVRVR